ncbi:hypothetical protein [Microlunatus soli]|uniref:Uncharacterized protein n=1 Tax=Microlunatus soli TaxID=630515 RepID=A0A1H1ZN32_9ACTN|nr:hypothetical protein [Microlunatus soli]SDT34977.1 hypothetical protein SAMN04489812_5326 [Microlunatus soli]
MTLPFHTRGRNGRLRINVHPNDDPYATGHDQVAKNFDASAFTGFPVLTAEVDFPREGPAGWFGWVQLIRHLRRGEVIDEEIDRNPLLAGTPLYVEGYRPTFADAPANPDHRDLDWLADAFLVSIGPARLSPVVGFSWGYRRFFDDRTDLIDPEPAAADAWERIRQRIRRDFADWETDPLLS